MSLKGKLKREKSEDFVRKSLIKEVYDAGVFYNILVSGCAIMYIIFTANIKLHQIIPVTIAGISVCVVLQFIVAPVSNKFITQNTSDDLDSFYNYGSDTKERTRLVKQLMALPEKIGVEVFLNFFIGIIVWTLLCIQFAHIDTDSVIMIIGSGVIGAYSGMVYGLDQTQIVCSRHAAKIIKEGVLKEEVEQRHSFGTSSTGVTIVHLFGPLCVLMLYFIVFIVRAEINQLPFIVLMPRIAFITIFNSIFYIHFSTMLFRRMMKSINNIKQIMEDMDRNSLEHAEYNETDLSNEFMYNIYLLNTIISTLQEILLLSQKISNDVIGSSNELSVISKETAATSLEQTTGIKELLSAMEESDRLAKNISEKIGEVTDLARVTTEDIDKGFDILTESMNKLEEIKVANTVTVDGIRSLSDKITGISDIATIISSIADQTNIIAFNAELEASSAGEAGENFHLVANEIRRLTNNTIQSTNEIQNKIIEIQHSSEELLVSSRKGSNAIDSGNKMVTKLNDSFESLKKTSSMAAVSSEEIKVIVRAQTASFEQIVVTLNQIHSAAENFSVSTQNISQSAENLCIISDKLKTLQVNNQEKSGE